MFLLRRQLSLATRFRLPSSGPECLNRESFPRRSACIFFPFALLLILTVSFSSARAQPYPASSIPEELKADADAVVRTSEYDIEIKSPSHAVSHEKKVYSILNSRGDVMADYRTYYDKMTSLNSVEGAMYNAEGKELRHFKKKDMNDRPVWDGMSLATDDRVKEISLTNHQYPYTVRFEEEDEMNGIMNLSNWLPQTRRNISVEYSRYTVTAPKDYVIRYKPINTDIKPVITENKGKVTYTWEIRNIKPVPDETFADSWLASQPQMLVGLSEFEAAGYKGNMSTWNDYGKFYAELSRGRDVLPDDVRARVHSLVAGELDVHKKISILYDYLQKNTHYISIQFGIGGLQPFDATYVARNKYGDCKALSNYMVAVLKEAGIGANAVIIRGGTDETDFHPDFPTDQFNHVICCVPLEKDTVWLECTDQYLPAGYLSGFTANRYGLLVTENGGKLIHTPDYALKENNQFRTVSAQVDAEGNVKLLSNGVYYAEMQDDLEKMLHHYSKSDQERMLKQNLDIPTYDIIAFDYKISDDGPVPVIRESIDITANGYAQVSGKRIFINPDILTRSGIHFPSGETRSRGIRFYNSYSLEDSVEIVIPDGYEQEALAKDKALKTVYGEYRTTTKVSPGKITYYRSFKQFRGSYPASSIAEVSAFYNSVYRSDREKIVLVKKQ